MTHRRKMMTLDRNKAKIIQREKMLNEFIIWYNGLLNEDINPRNFYKEFRTGERICNIINFIISPPPIKKIIKAKTAFQSAENIENYNKACEIYFKIPLIDLFQPGDLVERRNLNRVIGSLHALPTYISKVKPEFDSIYDSEWISSIDLDIAYSLQWPPLIELESNEKSSSIYGQIWSPEFTVSKEYNEEIFAEVGFGEYGTHPKTHDWKWFPAKFHKKVGENFEYVGEIIFNEPGIYNFTYRYKLNDSRWMIADRWDRKEEFDNVKYPNPFGIGIVKDPLNVINIASLNVYGPFKMSKQGERLNTKIDRKADELAKVIFSSNIDIVLIQENVKVGENKSLTQMLIDRLNRFSQSLLWTQIETFTHKAWNEWDEGISTISRFPIAGFSTKLLNKEEGGFPRKALSTRIATPSGIIDLINIHLNVNNNLIELLDVLNINFEIFHTSLKTPHLKIIGGDFNTEFDNKINKLIKKYNLIQSDPDLRPTFKSFNPWKKIDHLLISGDINIQKSRIIKKIPLDKGFVSDHLGLFISLHL